MSTICFDIKRVDDDYVCIQHCNTNYFEYEYHLPLSFYPRKRKGKDHWWIIDKKYRYVWILVGKDMVTGIETIFWACNDKVWLNHILKIFKSEWASCYAYIRIVKLPFESKEKFMYKGKEHTRFVTSDLKDKFKLYCPVALNKQYHVYYEETLKQTLEEELL